MTRPRKSTISVYQHGWWWVYRVDAPNHDGGWLTVMQGCLASEAEAQSSAEHQAKFYDDLERWRVRGGRERRMKRPTARGERICQECGDPHDCYEVRKAGYKFPSWAHPVDGHSYRAEPWETLARRLLDEKVVV
jgi:hypothetical protein